MRTAAQELGWPEECLQAHTLTGSIGPGNAVSVFVTCENVTDVFTAFGAKRVPAETVALEAAKQARRYINSGAGVGEHLADQLLLPLAVGAGGAFTTTPLSTHAQTNIEVIGRFVDTPIAVEEISQGRVGVRVGDRVADRRCSAPRH